VERAFPWPRPGPLVYVKALRAHQWIKNLLVFLPVLAAHEIGNPAATLASLLAFVAFNACASSVYLLNDLLDLPADRRHRSKRNRPFAAGTLPLEQGVVLIPLLLVIALLVSLALPPTFVLVLLLYYLITTAYSFKLKRVMMLDVVILAGLYTIRVVAGSAATEIPLTYWLFAFSMFIFLSLALVKRYTELIALRDSGAGETAEGRGYEIGDLEILSSLGTASGYLAVLVLALYISSAEVQLLYHDPVWLWGACPILLYWISRMWIITHRGGMTDDPIVFAVKDRNSLLCGLLVLSLMTWGL
jgi:4-hydroxybenzoate polyprenyltransferase